MLEIGQDLALGAEALGGGTEAHQARHHLDGDPLLVLAVVAHRGVDHAHAAAAQLALEAVGSEAARGVPIVLGLGLFFGRRGSRPGAGGFGRAHGLGGRRGNSRPKALGHLEVRPQQGLDLAAQGVVLAAGLGEVGLPRRACGHLGGAVKNRPHGAPAPGFITHDSPASPEPPGPVRSRLCSQA
ncbi:MAG: hypothetical protein AAF725_24270 [Acidobacteriota bacterium]